MKTITLKEDVWKRLWLDKLKYDLSTISDVVERLLDKAKEQSK